MPNPKRRSPVSNSALVEIIAESTGLTGEQVNSVIKSLAKNCREAIGETGYNIL